MNSLRSIFSTRKSYVQYIILQIDIIISLYLIIQISSKHLNILLMTETYVMNNYY